FYNVTIVNSAAVNSHMRISVIYRVSVLPVNFYLKFTLCLSLWMPWELNASSTEVI
ncbi:hypothetical protein U0070_017661, partial [Myodes glareolus]